MVERSIEYSTCVGVYDGQAQVALARIVTDYATFAWLCDVFVLETHQRRGIGKWLVETVVASFIGSRRSIGSAGPARKVRQVRPAGPVGPDLQDLRNWTCWTCWTRWTRWTS